MNFIVFKKSQMRFTALVVAVTAVFIFAFSALGTTSKSSATGITVVLDAGHGGIDGGVKGVKTGVLESDLNLEITRKVEKRLQEAGINVILTRKTESGLYGIAVGSFKKRDMKKRRDIIKKARPSAVISIHMNKFPVSSRRGAQVFFKGGDELGKTLADSIQQKLNDMEEATRSFSALMGDYYILNCTDYPSVIVECGFLSNAEDERLLCDAEYQEKISYVIFKGIINYLTTATYYPILFKK